MAITDLTGTTWLLNDPLVKVGFDISSSNGLEFESNGEYFDVFLEWEFSSSYGIVVRYRYASGGYVEVHNGYTGWISQAYRTVKITGGLQAKHAPTIEWFTKNGVLIRDEWKVTYRVVHGTWADGTTEPLFETVFEGDSPANIPTGMIGYPDYVGGRWIPDPNGAIITGHTTFDYTFHKLFLDVKYYVVNGKWANGTTAPITEIVQNEGTPTQIPTGMTPIAGYTGGAWDTNPQGAVITNDTNYYYRFTSISPTPSIPSMASVIPYYRLKSGGQVSEWIQKGEFFIDTRSVSNNWDGINVFEAQCFDSMLKANASYTHSALTFPALDTDMIAEICSRLGFVQDERNASVLTRGYRIPSLLQNLTYRDALSYIGVMYAANWIFSDDGKLRIVPIAVTGDTLNVDRSVQTLEESPIRSGYTKVSIAVSDGEVIESGTSEDNVMEAECPWATQEIADYVYSILSDWQYKPCTASGVWSDPAVEIFDTVETATNDFTVFSRDLSFGPAIDMDLSAPNDNYIEHEYSYVNPSTRRSKNTIKNIEKEMSDQKVQLDLIVENGEINGAGIIDAINYVGSGSKINADKINWQGVIHEEVIIEGANGHVLLDDDELVFLDTNDEIKTRYPATGLGAQDLNGNESETVTDSGSTKTYTLDVGIYLIATAKMDDTSTAQDSLFMASVGETGVSHISEILTPTGTTTVVLTDDTLTVTTGDANVQVVINKIG